MKLCFLLFFMFSICSGFSQNETVVYAWHSPDSLPQKMIPMCWVRDDLETYYPSYQMNQYQEIANHLNNMPEGKRVIFLWDHHMDMAYNELDYLKDGSGQIQGYTDNAGIFRPFPPVWWDSGAMYVKTKHQELFRNLFELGVKLDLVVLDYEHKMSNWLIESYTRGFSIPESEINSVWGAYYHAIEIDPRFDAMSSELGFTDLLQVKNYWGQDYYLKFNDYWSRERTKYINKAIFEPLRTYYPEAEFHNYQDALVNPMVPVPDNNGHRVYCCGNTGSYSGTQQTESFYGWLNHITTTQIPEGATSFEFSSFNGLLYNTFKMKSLASEETPFSGWIAYKSFMEGDTFNYVTYSNSPHYDENLLHLLMSGSDHLIYWNPSPAWGGPGTNQSHQDAAEWVNYLVSEFDMMWEAAPPKHSTFYPNALTVDWQAPFVLTSRESDSLILWRLTPKLNTSHSNPLSFRNADQTVMQFEFENTMLTFPEGTEILEINASPQSGLWLAKRKQLPLQLSEQVKDVQTIISYPNPASEELYVFSESKTLMTTNWKVVDVMQREIKTTFIEDGMGLKLDVSCFASGTYYLIFDQYPSVPFQVKH